MNDVNNLISNKKKDVNDIDIDSDEYSNNGDSDHETEEINEHVPEISEIGLSKKEIMIYKVMDKYYRSLDIKNVETMIQIVDGKSKISLRLLDWFVTRYANKYKVRFDREEVSVSDISFDTKVDRGFNVHISYKSQLKSYTKKYFDPFRRRKKFKYYFNKDKNIWMVTTIGQLNFFKWAFCNNIISYVDDNYVTISKAMVNTNKVDKTRKTKEKQVKQEHSTVIETNNDNNSKDEEISVKKNGINITAKKKLKQDEVKIVLSFD